MRFGSAVKRTQFVVICLQIFCTCVLGGPENALSFANTSLQTHGEWALFKTDIVYGVRLAKTGKRMGRQSWKPPDAF